MPCLAISNRTLTYIVFSIPILPLHDETNWKCPGWSIADIRLWKEVPLLAEHGTPVRVRTLGRNQSLTPHSSATTFQGRKCLLKQCSYNATVTQICLILVYRQLRIGVEVHGATGTLPSSTHADTGKSVFACSSNYCGQLYTGRRCEMLDKDCHHSLDTIITP